MNLLYSLYKDRIPRRSDLQGIELGVTTLSYQQEIKDAMYGSQVVAKVGGLFEDQFMILCKNMNFTFNLQQPKDNKWGRKDPKREKMDGME